MKLHSKIFKKDAYLNNYVFYSWAGNSETVYLHRNRPILSIIR